MADILIIDGDKTFSSDLEKRLDSHGLPAACCDSLPRAMGLLHTGDFKVVLLGDDLNDGDSLAYLSTIREIPSFPEVIVISRSRDPDMAENAIQNGAWNYMTKPLNMSRLMVLLKRVVDYQEERTSGGIRCSLRRSGIIGNSRPLQACLDTLAQAAGSEANVLISGETGTGKELFARAIHKNSSRCRGNFVVVDCAALPDTLAENILFGHERGAYTSADATSVGLVKQAHKGTLFLDEVGELPVSMQKVFLRVLEGRHFRPVGATKEIRSDFRLLAATNRDLKTMVKSDDYRRDLYYRLRGIYMRLPSATRHHRGHQRADLQVHPALFQAAEHGQQGVLTRLPGRAHELRLAGQHPGAPAHHRTGPVPCGQGGDPLPPSPAPRHPGPHCSPRPGKRHG